MLAELAAHEEYAVGRRLLGLVAERHAGVSFIAQQQALFTYKDEELPTGARLRDAVAILERIGLRDPGCSDAETLALGGAVYKVRFWYHDATGWRDSFDSLAHDGLPAAVEIAVWFHPWPGEEREDPGAVEYEMPERLTFDQGAGFDEAAYARESDLEFFDEPKPDRIRVIVIPDATADDPYAQPEDSLDLALGVAP